MEVAPNKRSHVRLNAIRSLLMGNEGDTSCAQFCRTDHMPPLWSELFNRGGINAQITEAKLRLSCKVKLACVRDLLVPVLENPAQAGQVHGPL
jgi:hypothetical protein